MLKFHNSDVSKDLTYDLLNIYNYLIEEQLILLDVSMNSCKNIERIVPKCCLDILHVRTIEGDKAKK